MRVSMLDRLLTLETVRVEDAVSEGLGGKLSPGRRVKHHRLAPLGLHQPVRVVSLDGSKIVMDSLEKSTLQLVSHNFPMPTIEMLKAGKMWPQPT